MNNGSNWSGLDSRFDFTRSINLKLNIISQIRDFLWWISMCFKSLYWMSEIDHSRNHHHYSLLSWFSTLKKGTTKLPTKTKIHIRLSGASEKLLKWQISHVLPLLHNLLNLWVEWIDVVSSDQFSSKIVCAAPFGHRSAALLTHLENSHKLSKGDRKQMSWLISSGW